MKTEDGLSEAPKMSFLGGPLSSLVSNLGISLAICRGQEGLSGANRKSPSCKGSGIFLFYNPKNVHCRSTGLPHALLLMKISPTDAREEKLFWPFGAMKREHAQVRAFGTTPGPLPYPHDILL